MGGDELEEERGLPDDDLAARFFGQPNLVRRPDPFGLALESREIGNAARQSDAPRHAIEKIEVVVPADQLEELELLRQIGLYDERRLFTGPHRHARALLDDALLEDAPPRDKTDA